MPARDRVAVRRVSGDHDLREVHPPERDRGHPLKILISAAEASSDAHGAELLRALRREAPAGGVDAFGVGGPRLQAEGLRAVVDARELLTMGFSEVLGRLPKIFRSLREVAGAAERERPAVAVVIDYPDFHFRLAARLRSQGVPVVYYIPPKVWAWRKGRVRILRERFARVLSILPFEEEFYRGERVDARYVGNPLLDELPRGRTRAEARKALGLGADERVLLLMPGSRPAELARHVPLLLEAAATARRERGGDLKVLMPLPATADRAAVERDVAAWRASPAGDSALAVRVSQGDAHDCLLAADAGLIKSGTSTLEAALLGCPHAVVYRPSAVTAWIVEHVVRYRNFASLVNLIAGKEVVKELLCGRATAPALSAEAVSLLSDLGRRERLASEFAEIRRRVEGSDPGTSPSVRAAREVLEVAAAHAKAAAAATPAGTAAARGRAPA